MSNAVILLALLCLWFSYSNAQSVPSYTPQESRVIFERVGGQFDVPWYLLEAISTVESNLNYRQVTTKQDGLSHYGLTGITYEKAKELGYAGSPDGLIEPNTNVIHAAKYLQQLLTQYRDKPGSMLWAISAYDAGKEPVVVNDQGTHPIFRNQAYVDAVAQAMGRLPVFEIM